MTPFVAELLGTMFILILGAGVVANALLNKTKGANAGILAITTAWALGVFIGVVVAAPYSGAHLNPAVTLGFALCGQFPWSEVGTYIIAQFLGAALGATLIWAVYYDHFKITDNTESKLAIFCTYPEIRHTATNFFCEFLGTFVLMFIVFYITGGSLTLSDTAQTLPVGLGSIGAIPVAFTVWGIGLALGGPTGYAINPARDLAPRVMHTLLPMGKKASSRWDYAWVPVIAPLCGASAAALLYTIL